MSDILPNFMSDTAVNLLHVDVNVTSYESVVSLVLLWSKQARGRMICFANVHMITEARRRPDLWQALQSADLINPDGVPLVWSLRAMGAQASRVYGPDCMLKVLQACSEQDVPVGLYGGSPAALERLNDVIRSKWPNLRIAYSFSPPFRNYSDGEEAEEIKKMVSSGVRVLFVGLGCPKQEIWIARNQSRIPVVMLAVGAAFDFIAGTKAQAPRWMMRLGLEWLFRCLAEPKRLSGRYLQSNPRFLFLMLGQLLAKRSLRA